MRFTPRGKGVIMALLCGAFMAIAGWGFLSSVFWGMYIGVATTIWYDLKKEANQQ